MPPRSVKPALPGGTLEHEILQTLWIRGQASARELHEFVGARSGLVYTTVAKVLDRLTLKGLVRRRMSGNSYTYTPAVERSQVDKAFASEALKRLLGSEPIPAIASLVDAVEDIDPELLDELERAVKSRRRKRRGP